MKYRSVNTYALWMRKVFLNFCVKKKGAFYIYKKGVMFTVLESVYSYKQGIKG